jgi:hypothetical protein
MITDTNSISSQLRESDALGAQLGKIMNNAAKKCNKLLKLIGYGVQFRAEFYKLEDKHLITENQEPKN